MTDSPQPHMQIIPLLGYGIDDTSGNLYLELQHPEQKLRQEFMREPDGVNFLISKVIDPPEDNLVGLAVLLPSGHEAALILDTGTEERAAELVELVKRYMASPRPPKMQA